LLPSNFSVLVMYRSLDESLSGFIDLEYFASSLPDPSTLVVSRRFTFFQQSPDVVKFMLALYLLAPSVPTFRIRVKVKVTEDRNYCLTVVFSTVLFAPIIPATQVLLNNIYQTPVYPHICHRVTVRKDLNHPYYCCYCYCYYIHISIGLWFCLIQSLPTHLICGH
jgi:hypothetical protein